MKNQKRNAGQIITRLLFLVYAGAMLWLLFGQRMEGAEIEISLGMDGKNLNFVPLETIKLYIRLLNTTTSKSLLRHAVINLAGNVVMFIPLGWFLPHLWRGFRGFFRTTLFSSGLICVVEGAQLLTSLGSCDVDDLILNVFGIILGYIIWKLVYRK